MNRFQDEDFQFALEVTLGAVYRQAADAGEALATAARIVDGDADSWLHEWTATAGAVWSAAVDAEQADRRVSAIVDGDADSWLHEWTATAGAVWSAAVDAEQADRRVSALAHAQGTANGTATYYATRQPRNWTTKPSTWRVTPHLCGAGRPGRLLQRASSPA